MKYNPQKIESKWRERWLDEKTFCARDDSKKQKYYQLETFPYPSAEGLHVGHPKGYIAEDIHARYMRMNGREVLYTMGWDAFGLPTENYAIKVGKSPKEVAEANIKNFKRQVQMFGLSYDWDREINTSSPEYYKWTQWLFIELFKKGLAYRAKARVNWCPKDQTVLANEQVVNGKCERCGTEIEEREMAQWFFKITDYAERLLDGLKDLDWPEATVKRQKDWIGKSEGAEIDFEIKTKANYVILHGFKGKSSDPQYKWLKSELEKSGFKCQMPQLPNTDTPSVREQVEFVLKNVKFDQNTILFGKSLGAVVAMKVAGSLIQPIGGLILAGGFLSMEGVYRKDYPFRDTFDWKFDFKKIKENTRFIKILNDLGDNVAVKPEQGEIIRQELGGELLNVFANKPHFGNEKEPALIEVLMPKIKVFTTRPDTLFGATYIVLAPEHNLISNLKSQISNWPEVQKYVEAAKHKTDLMRQEEAGDKTGVELKGAKAINPATKEEIPVWVADYVLAGYGTGAIMAVPAHDERDFEFAKKYDLPTRQVIEPFYIQNVEPGVYRDGESIVPREGVITIVKHWSENKYIGLRWKKVAWGTFITGGVEKGQTPEEAAIAEIREETGFLHPKFVKEFGVTHGLFYHVPKKENRLVHGHILYFELQDDSREEISEGENAIHEIKWLTSEELQTFLTPAAHTYALSLLRGTFKTFTGTGVLMNSDKFSGMDSEKAKSEITKFVGGQEKIRYKLRDWSVSRQRYWGVPIPMVYCEKCGVVPVEEQDLPVLLPGLENYRPKGMPPLASDKKFISTTCPKCGGKAERSAETLDTFVDSSWYYFRYTDPKNNKEPFDKNKAAHWLPVDLYVIGAEHTVLHLLYSRFITKFLHDIGWIKFEEPFLKLRHQGLILGTDGKYKMSKSKGNVVNPDQLIKEFGADTVRLYEMFMGPFEDGAPWDPKGMLGAERFLKRAWNYLEEIIGLHNSGHISKSDPTDSSKLGIINKTIKKVGEDIGNFKFNTAISSLMILLNELYATDEKTLAQLNVSDLSNIIKLLYPFAPHMAQELWESLENKSILDFEKWPEYDEKLIQEEKFTLVIQINGKFRDSVEVSADISEAEAKDAALGRDRVKKMLGTQKPKKVIYVPKKLINIVV